MARLTLHPDMETPSGRAGSSLALQIPRLAFSTYGPHEDSTKWLTRRQRRPVPMSRPPSRRTTSCSTRRRWGNLAAGEIPGADLATAWTGREEQGGCSVLISFIFPPFLPPVSRGMFGWEQFSDCLLVSCLLRQHWNQLPSSCFQWYWGEMVESDLQSVFMQVLIISTS